MPDSGATQSSEMPSGPASGSPPPSGHPSLASVMSATALALAAMGGVLFLPPPPKEWWWAQYLALVFVAMPGNVTQAARLWIGRNGGK